MAKIKILDGDPSNGSLVMSDNGHTNAARRETIKWKLKDNSNVASIECIYLKSKECIIFSMLKKVSQDKWIAVIDKDAPIFDRCEYGIRWKDSKGVTRDYDPIIAIKPSSFVNRILKIVFLFLAPFLVLFSVNLFLGKNRK